MFKRLLFVLMLLLAGQSFALNQKAKIWLGGDADRQFMSQPDLYFNLFMQSRFGDNDSNFEELIVRPSIHYDYSPAVSAWIGYDYRQIVPNNRFSATKEQRVWPQVQFVKRFERTSLSARSRYELRWRENSSEFGNRFRQRFEYTLQDFMKPGISLDISEELFFNTRKTAWLGPETFDQNRVFIGLVMPVNQNIVADFGYLNVYRPFRTPSRMDHVLVLAFSFDGQAELAGPLQAI